jgi:hypothetical protein
VLLGSAVARLRGGQSSRVRVLLSQHAITLLRQRGHLSARIETILRTGGTIVAERTQLVTLAPPAGAARTG